MSQTSINDCSRSKKSWELKMGALESPGQELSIDRSFGTLWISFDPVCHWPNVYRLTVYFYQWYLRIQEELRGQELSVFSQKKWSRWGSNPEPSDVLVYIRTFCSSFNRSLTRYPFRYATKLRMRRSRSPYIYLLIWNGGRLKCMMLKLYLYGFWQLRKIVQTERSLT